MFTTRPAYVFKREKQIVCQGCVDRARDERHFEEVGKTYNNWTIVDKDWTTGDADFFCDCACGNTKGRKIRLIHLKNGHTKSCGCIPYDPSWALDLKDKVFGNLTAKKIVGVDKDRRKLWECHCTCGNTKVVNTNRLMTGDTR